MVARIKLSEGKSYDSVVFAAYLDGAESYVLIFDESNQKLIQKRMYTISNDSGIVQDLVITNWDTDGMLSDEKMYRFEFVEGYERRPWELGREAVEKCKEMQRALRVKEWNEVTDQSSVIELMKTASGFHDGDLCDFEESNGVFTISISVWGGRIHMKLKNAKFSPDFSHRLYNVYDANIFFEDERIYFVDSYNVRARAELDQDHCWFSCERLEWKMTLDGGIV